MSQNWDLVPLGEILIKSNNWIQIEATKKYKQITVKIWGKGVVKRNEVMGTQMAASQRLQVRSGQFIVSRIDARHGAFGLIPDCLDGAVVTNDFPVFNLNLKIILPQFLNWMSKIHTFIELCKASSEGTTNRVRLKEDKFLSMKIPIPPLQEQQRIVAKIEELAAKIEEARGLKEAGIRECEALILSSRAKIFNEVLQYQTIRLDKAANLERGKFSHRPRNEPRFFNGDHPWIQIGEIESSNKYIDHWSQTLNDDGLAVSKKFTKGTLLISIAATIGAVGILNFDCCIPDSIVGINPKSDISSEYLYYYLCYLRNNLEKIAPQNAQKNINLKILGSLPVPYLPLPQQQEIFTYLDNLQTKIDEMKRLRQESLKELDALLRAILDKAFKGEL